jgi:glycosyltransferase involved in cell wall biosynthesis
VFDVPGIGAAYKVAARGKRAAYGLWAGRFDAVFLQRLAFDGSSLPEAVLARVNPRMILDVDDAIFLNPGDGSESTRRSRAFRGAVGRAAHVIAGNRFLAGHAGAPEKTTIVPTVIDTRRYVPAPERTPGGPLVIGWMGTAGNFRYFDPLLPAIRQLLAERPDVVFRIVSNGSFRALESHPQVQQVRWSEAAELQELGGFDIGVMPLVDSAWTRGKNGFKLIQYMAVGAAAVASPVGVNAEIADGGRSALLASSPGEWHQALTRLCRDAALRRQLGESARRRIVEHYSIASVLGTYMDLFSRVGGGGPRNRIPGGA